MNAWPFLSLFRPYLSFVTQKRVRIQNWKVGLAFLVRPIVVPFWERAPSRNKAAGAESRP